MKIKKSKIVINKQKLNLFTHGEFAIIDTFWKKETNLKILEKMYELDYELIGASFGEFYFKKKKKNV